MDQQICAICLADQEETRWDNLCNEEPPYGMLSECGHCFCWKCICQWSQTTTKWTESNNDPKKWKSSCPICRKKSTSIRPSHTFPKNSVERRKLLTKLSETWRDSGQHEIAENIRNLGRMTSAGRPGVEFIYDSSSSLASETSNRSWLVNNPDSNSFLSLRNLKQKMVTLTSCSVIIFSVLMELLWLREYTD